MLFLDNFNYYKMYCYVNYYIFCKWMINGLILFGYKKKTCQPQFSRVHGDDLIKQEVLTFKKLETFNIWNFYYFK